MYTYLTFHRKIVWFRAAHLLVSIFFLITQAYTPGPIVEDSDSWLTVSPEELDELLQARQIRTTSVGGQADESSIASGLSSMTDAFTRLLGQTTSHEGVETSHLGHDDDDDGVDSDDGESDAGDSSSDESDGHDRRNADQDDDEDISFDPDTFVTYMQDLLGKLEGAVGPGRPTAKGRDASTTTASAPAPATTGFAPTPGVPAAAASASTSNSSKATDSFAGRSATSSADPSATSSAKAGAHKSPAAPDLDDSDDEETIGKPRLPIPIFRETERFIISVAPTFAIQNAPGEVPNPPDAAIAAELEEADVLDGDVELDTNLLENLLKSYAAQEVSRCVPLGHVPCTVYHIPPTLAEAGFLSRVVSSLQTNVMIFL